MSGFHRIKDRKLVQWALAYLAAAWLLLQVLDMLGGTFGWPDVVLRVATVLAPVGLIGVLVLAWYHGEQGRQHMSGTELLLLAGVLVLAGVAVWWARAEPASRASVAAADSAARADSANAAAVGVVERHSIAVLPFADISRDRDQEYLSDGITEEILNALARVPGLRVAARTSSFAFKSQPDVPIDEVAKRLRVAHVLEGSVMKMRDSLRISAKLIDAATGYHVWSERYDRTLADVFAVQEEISRAIVDRLRVHLATPGGEPADVAPALIEPPTHDLQAYELYLRGRHGWATRTPEGLRRAVQYFEQAIRRDTSFARAYAGLADALIVMPIYTDVRPADVQPRAKAAALRAIAFDSTLAEAHASLAYVRMSYERDWAAAEQGFQHALRINPSHVTANHWYGDLLGAQHRLPEALTYYERASRLDPLSPVVGFALGWLYMANHRFDESVAQFHRTLALDSTLVDTHTHLARTLLFQGKHDEAIAGLEKAVALSGRRPNELAFLGHAYAIAGRRNDAQRILDELQARARSGYVSPLNQAFVYIGLNDHDRAFAALERARAAGDPWLTENNFDLVFDPLRADPRWPQLLRAMGLSR